MKFFQLKTKIYSEAGSIQWLSQVKGERAFIVTDEVMVKLGLVDKVTQLLEKAGVNFQVFSEVEPDPSIETIVKGVKDINEFKPSLIIAVGGGSSMDAAKAIGFFQRQFAQKSGLPEAGSRLLFVAIPTTSGTGSEVTSFSVITDRQQNAKFPLANAELIPDVAILDPDFVKTVPPVVTADTGLDALTQAIEAYVSIEASDYTNAFAEKAIRMIFRYLLKAYKNGADISAREKMHNASCMAGVAFNNAFLGINHSLAHVLGGRFHLSHGRANAIMLPYVIEYNSHLDNNLKNLVSGYTRGAKKYADIAKMIGLPASTVPEGVKSLIEAIGILNKELGIPRNLQEAGISKQEFENELMEISRIALDDYCTRTNPRIPTALEIASIFKKAYDG